MRNRENTNPKNLLFGKFSRKALFRIAYAAKSLKMAWDILKVLSLLSDNDLDFNFDETKGILSYYEDGQDIPMYSPPVCGMYAQLLNNTLTHK